MLKQTGLKYLAKAVIKSTRVIKITEKAVKTAW
jgi:hypothetical protein